MFRFLMDRVLRCEATALCWRSRYTIEKLRSKGVPMHGMAFSYTTHIPEVNKMDLGGAIRNEHKDRESNFVDESCFLFDAQ